MNTTCKRAISSSAGTSTGRSSSVVQTDVRLFQGSTTTRFPGPTRGPFELADQLRRTIGSNDKTNLLLRQQWAALGVSAKPEAKANNGRQQE